MATTFDQKFPIPIARAEHYLRESEPWVDPNWGYEPLQLTRLVVHRDYDPGQVTLAALPDASDAANSGYCLEFDLDPEAARLLAHQLLTEPY